MSFLSKTIAPSDGIGDAEALDAFVQSAVYPVSASGCVSLHVLDRAVFALLTKMEMRIMPMASGHFS